MRPSNKMSFPIKDEEIDFLLYSPIDHWDIKDPITLPISDFRLSTDLSVLSASQTSSPPNHRAKQLACQEFGCPMRIASFNYPGYYPGIYCVEHKKRAMVNVRSDLCQVQGCHLKASFNYPDQYKAIFCEAHKLAEMVNFNDPHFKRSYTCLNEGCQKRALFNYPGQANALLCLTHKTDKMRLVSNLECCKPGCTERPIYASPGKTTHLYCLIHRKRHSINVSHRPCQNHGCQRMASYGYPEAKKPLFCSSHPRPLMVRLKMS